MANEQECVGCVWRLCCGLHVVFLTLVLSAWTSSTNTTDRSVRQASLSQDILARYPGQDDYISPTRMVVVAEGGVADLPCDLTSTLASDPALLALWYKQGVTKPIYSYDVREGPAAHWRNSHYLGARAVFYAPTHALHAPTHALHASTHAFNAPTNAYASYLRIQGVLGRDQGSYTCKVHFRASPTLTFTTNLTVVVQPRNIGIYTEGGLRLGAMTGPHAEGDTLRIICRVTGGSPAPVVTWREGPRILDLTSEIREADDVRSMLVVTALARADLRREFTCQALNSNLTQPLSVSVTLDMHLPPLWVRLLSSREPLSAGWPYCLVCQAVGARPSPVFTWHLGTSELTSHTQQATDDDNVTLSELRWTPRQEDDGKVLSCQAVSPSLPPHVLADDWTIDIYYVPVARLEPGRSVNLGDIKEGDDVYFECSITSNPRVYKVIWIHEGQELHHNVSAGVIVSNQSLVMQRVGRAASGQYSCVASNIQGDGYSNPQLLRVKYSPVCRQRQMVYLGAARYEQVSVTCDLDAFPAPLDFRWTFNNSGESADVPQEHIISRGWRSTVVYTPNTELDYGTLLCWGLNSVGLQRHPCVFHTFPADHPDPVHNCTVHNVSKTTVDVGCVAGFDGGLPQSFFMELYEAGQGRLLANITNKVPVFTVEGLEAGLALEGVVYAYNNKGRGEEVALSAHTLVHIPERRTAAVKPLPEPSVPDDVQLFPTTTTAVLVSVSWGALLLVVFLCVVVRLRGRAGVVGEPPVDGLSKINEAAFKDPNPAPDSCRIHDENPDVIPQSETQAWHERRVKTITSAASLLDAYQALHSYQPAGSGGGGALLQKGVVASSYKLNNLSQQYHSVAPVSHSTAPVSHSAALVSHAAAPVSHRATHSHHARDLVSSKTPVGSSTEVVGAPARRPQELYRQAVPFRSPAEAGGQECSPYMLSSKSKRQEQATLTKFSAAKGQDHLLLTSSSAARALERDALLSSATKEQEHDSLMFPSAAKERELHTLMSSSAVKGQRHSLLMPYSTAGEGPTLRCEGHPRELDTCSPLITGQKESSV
nr:nephrin-like [Procambarus clarkii]